MNAMLRWALALLATLLAGHATAQVTFYEREDFEGRSFTAVKALDDFHRAGFNDRASSVVVTGYPWEVCEHVRFGGQCMILRPGSYRSLRDMRMNNQLSSARPAKRHGRHREDRYAPAPVPGQITFFEHDGFQGRAFTTGEDVVNFHRFGFNDQASSALVLGERWEVCEHVGFSGRCVILRPGRYPDLGSMGLNNRISSVRVVHPEGRFEDTRYAPPPPAPAYDWRRRPRERIYHVNVVSVRAVYAAPQQRCWVERERVVREHRGAPNAGGAVIGGIVGGILGHQVGGPHRDAATVAGAVTGAVIGAQIGRAGQTTTVQDVQRCETVPPHGPPEYWDVTYHFRGIEHHVQMTAPPGPTLMVNENGEPRI
jgi:uncharacterized protein YcfJ